MIGEESHGLLREMWQVELSLWTFSLSTIFAYIWWQFSLKGLLKAGLVLTVTTFASFGAIFIVIGAHLLRQRSTDSLSVALGSDSSIDSFTDSSRLLQGVFVKRTGFPCLSQN